MTMQLEQPDDGAARKPAAGSPVGGAFRQAGLGLWLFVAALILFFAFTTPGFFSSTNALNVLRQMSVLAIAAFGSSFVIFSGGLDLAIGSNAALSGVLAAMAARTLNFPGGAELSWVVGMLVGAAFGFVNSQIVIRLNISPIITTLGTLTVGRGLALLLTGGVSLFGVPLAFQGLGRGFAIPGILPIPVIIMIVVGVLGWVALPRIASGDPAPVGWRHCRGRRSRAGRKIRGGGLMTAAAKRTMPVGLWARLMVRLWQTTMRLRIARLLVWLVKTLRL
jgi:ribose transport system permease protein